MARFMVIHTLNVTQIDQEQVFERFRELVASPLPGAEWMKSWWAVDIERLFCEWEASDADAIRTSLESVKDIVPIEVIHEVQPINPQWYES